MARRRRVVVTGAAGGIGEAIVRRFLASGDKVAGLDIDAAGVERLGQAVSDGGEFLGIPFDLAYIEEIPKVVRRIIERFGGVDVLVNNAYYIHNMSLREMAFDDGWRREVSVNLEAPLKLSQECARDMAARGWGRIINLSSLSADFPAPGSSVYAMLKGAVNSLTKGLALELVGQGIRVNAVAPAMIATPARLRHGRQRTKKMIGRMPIRRLGRPEEVAETVAYLASEAADFLVGSILQVDGGFHLM